MPASEIDPVQVRDLTVEAHGPTVLILRGAGADEAERRLFRTIPVVPGDGLVLASARAVGSKAFRTALQQACRMALTFASHNRPPTSDGPRLFLALSGSGRTAGRGRALAQKISREFAAQVFAPDGPVTFVPGGSIFTGTDHHGWVRFAGGSAGDRHSARYPCPPWEPMLPRGTVTNGGLHTRPVPAGLAVSASEASAEDAVSHAVPVSPGHPRIVLGSPGGEPIEPRQVAALLWRFPVPLREQIQLVPSDPRTASTGWLGKLAELVGHDVVSATGVIRHGGRSESVFVTDERGNPLWQPFSALLRHSPDGRVLPVRAAAPPQGWIASGPLQYRWGRAPGPQPGPHELVAKVVPSGLALIPAAQAAKPGSADRLAFEAERLTITLGWPCAPLPEDTPAMLRRLLAGLRPEQLARVRLLVLGLAGEPLRAELSAAAGAIAGRMLFPVVLSAEDDAMQSAISLSDVDGVAIGETVMIERKAIATTAAPSGTSHEGAQTVSAGPPLPQREPGASPWAKRKARLAAKRAEEAAQESEHQEATASG